jgi:hypothetical protein
MKLRWPVRFEVVPPDAETSAQTAAQPVWHEARIRGIGIGGTFIETDVVADEGTRLRLQLFPPRADDGGDPTAFSVCGEVRWVSDGRGGTTHTGLGVAFCDLTAEDEIRLHGYFSASLKMV